MILLFVVFVFLTSVFLGIPLVWAILLTAILPVIVFDLGFPLQALYLNFIAGVEPNHFLAIPLFIVAGELMSRGGVGTRIIGFARAAFGFMPGGLGMVVVGASMIFGGISGSAIADSAAIGSVMIKNMAKEGYNKGFSAGLVAAAGTIGIIIPPSIPMLIYGFVGNVSVADLFLAGMIPGLIFGIFFMGVCYYIGKSSGCDPGGHRTTKQELIQSFLGTAPALFMPVLILGGIFSGWVTPTEAAALAVVYGLIVTIFVYRDFKILDLPSLIIDAFVTSAVVMVVIGATSVLGWLITLEQMPQIMASFVQELSEGPWMFLLLVNIVLLLLGLVLDPVPAILLTAPLFLPTAQLYGVDPVHLGVIMTCNVAVGLFTPPVGATLYVASRISGVGVLSIARRMLPLYVVAIAALMLVTYVPAVSMTMVELFR
ncbi:TRAP transporter large permease [Aestuariirhabdus sp. Z084]|uniref:TRAP transporter large permease n=1 Tax=Aestuariirhabdus haliotis TaxID=2918751 RepID=UPI00201B4282|nr:TRAP transporter large permease [Aestuariirhabdus haliotis]MCL6416502.1 TRAP transporter large permease [Aestuariirhabdus haliotis]MCL6420492.1 TRAP transporter large permease [Aestuariirhabdus haliotis]